MWALYNAWPADRIVQTVSGQSLSAPGELTIEQLAEVFSLRWSAYVVLLRLGSEDAQRACETETLRGDWSVRKLRRQIDSQFYERIAFSRSKAAMPATGGERRAEDVLTPEEAILGSPGRALDRVEYRSEHERRPR